jgi:YVTN family beta-propeller protein
MITPTPNRIRAGKYTGSVRSTYATGAGCRCCVFTKDSRYIWCANYTAGNITKIDVYTGVTVKTWPLAAGLTGICLSPDELTAYTCNDATSQASKVDLTTGAVTNIGTAINPRGLSILPNGNRIYVAGITSNAVHVINTATFTSMLYIATLLGPIAVAVAPDGKTAIASCFNNNGCSIIDLTTNLQVATFATGLQPHFGAWSKDSLWFYTANFGGNNSTVCDIKTNFPWPSVAGLAPLGCAVSVDGTLIYMGCHDSNYIRKLAQNVPEDINLIDNGTLAVGLGAWSIAMSPNGRLAACINNGADTVSIIRLQT